MNKCQHPSNKLIPLQDVPELSQKVLCWDLAYLRDKFEDLLIFLALLSEKIKQKLFSSP